MNAAAAPPKVYETAREVAEAYGIGEGELSLALQIGWLRGTCRDQKGRNTYSRADREVSPTIWPHRRRAPRRP